MFNVFNRGMKTKSFKEVVPIKRVFWAYKFCKQAGIPQINGFWQDSLARRHFLLSDSTRVNTGEYATLYSVCIPQLSDHREWENGLYGWTMTEEQVPLQPSTPTIAFFSYPNCPVSSYKTPSSPPSSFSPWSHSPWISMIPVVKMWQ